MEAAVEPRTRLTSPHLRHVRWHGLLHNPPLDLDDEWQVDGRTAPRWWRRSGLTAHLSRAPAPAGALRSFRQPCSRTDAAGRHPVHVVEAVVGVPPCDARVPRRLGCDRVVGLPDEPPLDDPVVETPVVDPAWAPDAVVEHLDRLRRHAVFLDPADVVEPTDCHAGEGTCRCGRVLVPRHAEGLAYLRVCRIIQCQETCARRRLDPPGARLSQRSGEFDVPRWAHIPEIAGSNPVSATNPPRRTHG